MSVTRLEEASIYCGVDKEVIIQFIQEEWIRPANLQNQELDEEDLARIKLIHDLKDEFGVNDEGISIILPLLDQLNRLHLEITRLQQQEI